MVDAVLNLGLPAPIDVQVAGTNLERSLRHRTNSSPREIRGSPAWPTSTFRRISTIRRCKLDVDRTRASELGLDQQEVVGNVITALTSQPDDRAQLLDRSQDRPAITC